MALSAVLDHPELSGLVLRHLSPSNVTALARASQTAHKAVADAFDAAPELLGAVARNHSRSLLKAHVMEWFALTSREADQLPRTTHPRRGRGGGFYYLYGTAAHEQVAALYAESDKVYSQRCVARNGSRFNEHYVTPPSKRARYMPARASCGGGGGGGGYGKYWVPTSSADCEAYWRRNNIVVGCARHALYTAGRSGWGG